MKSIADLIGKESIIILRSCRIVYTGKYMYYVPDGTIKCGYYECSCCGEKFLSLQTMDTIDCIYCEQDVDYEVGPDEDMSEVKDTARLIQVLEDEDVEKMDTLLSLAITGGNYDWI